MEQIVDPDNSRADFLPPLQTSAAVVSGVCADAAVSASACAVVSSVPSATRLPLPASVLLDLAESGELSTLDPGSVALFTKMASVDAMVNSVPLDLGASSSTMEPPPPVKDSAVIDLPAQDTKIPNRTTQQSYAKVVKRKETMTHHNVVIDNSEGEQLGLIPDDLLTSSPPLWEDLILGQFPDNSPHIAKDHVTVNKIWTYGDKTARIDAFVVNSSTIKFRIRDRAARERILHRGMWNIADRPMVVSKVGPQRDDTPPPLLSMPLWVKVKNVPPGLFSWDGLSFLTSVVGIPRKLHPDTELCKEYDVGKILVDADLTKELPISFGFKYSTGEKIAVKFSYPWLPPKCNRCAKWGHFEKTCRRPICKQPEVQVSILKSGQPQVTGDIQKPALPTTSPTEIPPRDSIISLNPSVVVSTQPLVISSENTDNQDETNLDHVLGQSDINQSAAADTIKGKSVTSPKDSGKEIETNWQHVSLSPKKQSSKNAELTVRDEFTISPSRFSPLEDDLEIALSTSSFSTDHLEEGEFQNESYEPPKENEDQIYQKRPSRSGTVDKNKNIANNTRVASLNGKRSQRKRN